MASEIDNSFIAMGEEVARLRTFDKWPFDKGCKCNAAKMAEAGFFHRPTETEPDAVQCFVCLKELDGWEPTDDPWEEHKNHTKDCLFAILGKGEKNLTVKELMRIHAARHKSFVRAKITATVELYRSAAADAKKVLRKV